MVIKQATEENFAYEFSFIEILWNYNIYDKETVKSAYKQAFEDSFMTGFSRHSGL